MIINKVSSLIELSFINLISLTVPGLIVGQTVGVFYDFGTPQHEFAAGDIKAALEAKNFTVEIKDISTLSEAYTNNKVVIALASNTQVTALHAAQGGSSVPSLGEQAYSLRTTTVPQISYWVLGGNDNGAMYGGLQVAENITFNGLTGTYNLEESPYIKNRGIKFNIPMDERSPTYGQDADGDAFANAQAHVWDMSFWTEWFDEMARHRYNVLSLWTNHPFSTMIYLEEYRNMVIEGVYGRDGYIKDMTIQEKIKFWQDVMAYGKNRGFDIYFYTWNVRVYPESNSYGISDGMNDGGTKTYMRKSMKKFLETYPDLTGFGVTAGENMDGDSKNEKSEWLYDTYGLGMRDYAEENPNRDLVFVHRQHQGSLSDITQYFLPLNDVPNIRVDLSFKYSKAHLHTAPVPGHMKSFLSDLSKTSLKTWIEARNDDFYYLHWGDPEFIRAYIAGYPDKDKYIQGTLIGADGWVWTRDFASKDPYFKDMLSIKRIWYMQKLWGRLFYNPNTPDALFKDHLANKYPEVSSDLLFDAWSKASRAMQIANEQVTGGGWQLDFQWWPEGWLNKEGYLSIGDTRSATPHRGSNRCSFQETADNNCDDGKISAWTTIDDIEQLAQSALRTFAGMGEGGGNTELKLTLRNLEAMAYLSLYSSNKYRAALSLEENKQGDAVDALGQAYCYWVEYTDVMDGLFRAADLQRTYDLESWDEFNNEVLSEYHRAGGSGTPSCNVRVGVPRAPSGD